MTDSKIIQADERAVFEAWAAETWQNSHSPDAAWIGWQGRAAHRLAHAGPADAEKLVLEGYRAAVSFIGADSWDGCSDCIEVLRMARAVDYDLHWSPDEIANALKSLRARTGKPLSLPAAEEAAPKRAQAPHDPRQHRGLELKAHGGRLAHIRQTGSERDVE